MSYAIGNRVKELRIKNDKSQEYVASRLGTTRQRYARLENGQVDISFVMIKKIAEILGVKTTNITSAESDKKGLTALFRAENGSNNVIESVQKIEEILRVFRAHEKLYNQMKVRENNEC